MESFPHRIVALGLGEIDRVESLWMGMVAHHREVAGGEWPVRGEQEAWALRRRQYAGWLEDGSGRMLAAAPGGEGAGPPAGEAGDAAELAGYAMLIVRASGATWEMGERVGDLESLAVAPAARGQGVGTLLIDACREALREDGVRYWGVSVVEANAGAVRLYDRAGFRPYYRSLMAEIPAGPSASA